MERLRGDSSNIPKGGGGEGGGKCLNPYVAYCAFTSGSCSAQRVF